MVLFSMQMTLSLWQLLTMWDVVQLYVMKCRMKLNSRKCKIMRVENWKGRMSWKNGNEIMEEVEEVLGCVV